MPHSPVERPGRQPLLQALPTPSSLGELPNPPSPEGLFKVL
jgi:hypothetical protein